MSFLEDLKIRLRVSGWPNEARFENLDTLEIANRRKKIDRLLDDLKNEAKSFVKEVVLQPDGIFFRFRYPCLSSPHGEKANQLKDLVKRSFTNVEFL